MENPFDYPTTIRDPRNFIGREDVLERIFGLLKKRQNVSLVGSKRIGKTSLLTCLKSNGVQEKFHFDGTKFLFLSLDLQRRSMRKHVDLFDDINFILREQSLGYSSEEGAGKDEEFLALLSNFQERGLHPVLMIDTFDEIGRYEQVDANMLSVLRWGGTHGQISYVTASVERMDKIFKPLLLPNSLVSAFENIFCTIKLRPFHPHEAAALLNGFSQREGLPFTEKEVSWIIKLAGHHPYLLQHVAAVLFEEKRTRKAEKMNLSLLRKEAQQNLSSHFEECWNMLSSDERQKLIEEVQEGEYEESDHPELIVSALFHTYLQETKKLETEPDLNPDELKKLLNHVNELGVLGESSLAKLPFITAQIEQQGATTVIARGKVIQDVLKEALEHIGGQGTRADEARDWRHYNILYYRYFMLRHSMNQDGIALRLDVSPRQYYRLFPEAVNRLLQVLLAMQEAKSPAQVSDVDRITPFF
jgi:AAA+ ATPase superfamily predicted ATPase